MAKCGNCNSKLGCSCKLRKASDGKSCCVNCIANYERVLKQSKKTNQISKKAPVGVIISATAKQAE